MKEIFPHRRPVDKLIPTGTYCHMVGDDYLQVGQMCGGGLHVHAPTPHKALKISFPSLLSKTSMDDLIEANRHPHKFLEARSLGKDANNEQGYLVSLKS